MDPIMMDENRPVWHSSSGFVLAVIGANAGYGMFIRLPYMVLAYGGGTFCIAFVVCLLIVAWPMTLFEVALGQLYRNGAVGAIRSVNPRLQGVGYASIIFASVPLAVFFSVILSWMCYFFVLAFDGATPMAQGSWDDRKRHFFDHVLYNGSGDYPVFICLVSVWVLVFLLTLKGMRVMAYAAYVAVPLPLVLVFALCIFSMTLGGSHNGINSFMAPHLADFADFQMWSQAFGHALLSMQLGAGVLFAYGSYCKSSQNVVRISGVIVIITLCMGLMICMCVSSMTGVLEIETVPPSPTSSGLYVPFVVFGSLIHKASFSTAISIVFFACIILLGIGFVAATINAVHTVVRDRVVLLHSTLTIGLLCLLCCGMAVPLCLGSRGYQTVMAIDAAVVTVCLPLFVLLESIGIGYLWSEKTVWQKVREKGKFGCEKLSVFVSVVYHHSVGTIRELMAKQGRVMMLQGIFPPLVKFIIPLGCLAAVVARVMHLFILRKEHEMIPIGIALVMPCASLVAIVLGALLASPRPKRLPWADEDTTVIVPTALTRMSTAASIGTPAHPANASPSASAGA